MQTLTRPSPPDMRTVPRTAHRRRSDRVLGLLLLGLSVVLVVAGVAGVAVKASGAYLDLGAHGSYHTDAYALTTDSTDWRTAVFGWGDSVRLEVAPADQKPIVVGVAAPDAVDRYLAGVGYSTISERTGSRIEHAGAAPSTPAARTVDWTARADGVGTLTLRWDATDGRQVAVAMNADGSRPVNVRVVSSAVTLGRMPWAVPAVPLVLGGVLLSLGVVVLQRTMRSGRGAVPPAS